MPSFLVWGVLPQLRPRPARRQGPGRRGGRLRPWYPFQVPSASFRVVGSSPTALALAAFLSSRGASVSLWTQDRTVRRAVRRQGGVVVDVVDDETRVVPVELACGAVTGEILVLVDPEDSQAALEGLGQAGAGVGPQEEPALVMVLPGVEALPAVFGKDGREKAWVPVHGKDGGEDAVAPGRGRRGRADAFRAGPRPVVVCGADPVQGRRLGAAAVRVERVSAWVPVEVRPEERSRRVLRRLSAYLPMLGRG